MFQTKELPLQTGLADGGQIKNVERINVTINMPSAMNIKAKAPKVSGANAKLVNTKCVVPICSKDLASRKALLHHYYMMHSEEKFFSCSTCQKAYRKKESLQVHVAKIHPDKPCPTKINILNQLLSLEKRLNKRYSSTNVIPIMATAATATSSQTDDSDVDSSDFDSNSEDSTLEVDEI